MPQYISCTSKRAILLLVISSLLINLVSCTTSQTRTEEENAVITFAGYTAQRSLYETLIDEFHNQNPGITVQFIPLPESVGGINSKYLRELASSADTVIITSETSRKAGSFFKDMQSLMDADPTFQPLDFWQGALSACQDSNGSLFGIPLTIGLHGIYFDQLAFANVDLAQPQLGWTWDDFREDVIALASQQGGMVRYGFTDDNTTFTSILGPQIDAVLVENNGGLDATSLQTQLQWYFDLVQDQALFPLQDTSASQLLRQALFQSVNRPAMWTGYLAASLPWDGGNTTNSDPWAGMSLFTLGFVPFPVDNETSHTTPAYTTCAAMSAGTSHSQAAWAWISFLSRQWVAQPELGAFGIAQVPARQSVAEAVGYWTKLPEKAVPAVRYGLAHAWFGPVYPQAFDAVQAAIVQTLAGEMDFATALEKTQEISGTEAAPETTLVTVATPQPVTTPQPTPAPDQNTITYLMNSRDFTEEEQYAVKTLAEAFNRDHPGMAVNVVSDVVEGMITVEMAKKSDCFTSYSWYLDLYQPFKESLLSLDALVETEDLAFLKDYSSALLEADRIDGELYALPAVLHPPVIFYNATLLAKRGLQPPTTNWNFNDFLNLITLAASTSEGDKSIGFMGGYDIFFQGRGVKWIDLDNNPPVININSPEMVSTLTWLMELYKSEVIHDRTVFEDEVTSGKIAFWLNEFGGPAAIRPGVSYQWGMASYPTMSGNTRLFNPSEVQSYFIAKTAKNPRVCWEWIKYLSAQPDVFNGIPARQSVVALPAWEAKIGKARADAYRQALAQIEKQTVPSEAQVTVTTWIQGWLGDAMDKVLDGSMDPQQALTEAQRKADIFLVCMLEGGYENLKGNQLSKLTAPCYAKADSGNP